MVQPIGKQLILLRPPQPEIDKTETLSRSIMPLLLQPSQSRQLLRSFARRSEHTRTPNYGGWWSLILDQPSQETDSFQQKKPIAIPIVEDLLPPVKVEEHPREIVVLQGKRIELPQKPPAPENCCMSGCAHCVWDIYQEDMEEYQAQKAEFRQRFMDAGEPLPPSLAPTSKSIEDQVQDEMDPTMKAFYALEKKMKGQ